MMTTPYIVFLWAAPLVIVALVTCGFVVNRRFLLEVTRRRLNAHVFGSRPSVAKLRATLRALTQELDRENLGDPLVELASFARSEKPDWIMGVHVGGRLLSVGLCDIIGHPPERCLFVSTHLSRNRVFTMEGEGGDLPSAISGSMMIIDDISRSGTTLRDLKNFLHMQNYAGELKLSRVSFAVLVVADKESLPLRKFLPDWAYFHTHEKYFRLPWTDTSIEVATAYDRRERNSELYARGMAQLMTDYNSAAIDEHEKQARHFAHALKAARSYLPIDKIKKSLASTVELAAVGKAAAS